MSVFTPTLDHSAYHLYAKLPRYNGKVSVCQAHCARDAAKVLAKVQPLWSQDDHLALAQKHAAEADAQTAAYEALLNAAAMETFGRPFVFTDYKISGIGCNEFSEEKKAALRFAAQASTCHQSVSAAHAFAGKRRQAVLAR